MDETWNPPPIIKEPIYDEDAGDIHDWNYGEDAGGYVFGFGKYQGRRIRQVRFSYITWCQKTLTMSRKLQEAIAAYFNGLRKFATTNYGDFIVPFGKKHQGQTIAQCRDKKWLRWIQGKQFLREKYPYFLRAVDQWLAHPRHQEVRRDIGKLLPASEYEEDLDLIEGSEIGDELTQEDLDFLDDSGVGDGTEDDGSDSYRTEGESGDGGNGTADNSLEVELTDDGQNVGESRDGKGDDAEAVFINLDETDGELRDKKGYEADTSFEVEATFTDPDDMDEHSDAPKGYSPFDGSASTAGPSRSSPVAKPSASRRRLTKSSAYVKGRFIRGLEHSDESDDFESLNSFIDDGSIKYATATSSGASSRSSPLPTAQKKQKKLMRDRPSEVRLPKGKQKRKSQRSGREDANSAYDSDNSDPPPVRLISSPRKSQTNKTPRNGQRKKTLTKTEINNSQNRVKQKRMGQRSDHGDAFNPNDWDPPEVHLLSSPSNPQTQKSGPSGLIVEVVIAARTPIGTQSIHTRRQDMSPSKCVVWRAGDTYADGPASSSSESLPLLSPKETPRTIRLRRRNTQKVEDENDDNGDDSDGGEEDDSDDGQNEVDNTLSEATAETSDHEDASESGGAKSTAYPSPPLTEATTGRRKKSNRRTQNIPDFVVSDPQSPDGSEDFEVASIAGTSNPKPSTPDSATPRYQTRASAKKATSQRKSVIQTPRRRGRLHRKVISGYTSEDDIPMTSRARSLKRSRKIALSSSEDDSSEGEKRPRLSPLNLLRRNRRRFQSEMDTIDGSVEGETVLHGSLIIPSKSSSSKTSTQLSPMTSRSRTRPTVSDDYDVFSTPNDRTDNLRRLRRSRRGKV